MKVKRAVHLLHAFVWLAAIVAGSLYMYHSKSAEAALGPCTDLDVLANAPGYPGYQPPDQGACSFHSPVTNLTLNPINGTPTGGATIAPNDAAQILAGQTLTFQSHFSASASSSYITWVTIDARDNILESVSPNQASCPSVTPSNGYWNQSNGSPITFSCLNQGKMSSTTDNGTSGDLTVTIKIKDHPTGPTDFCVRSHVSRNDIHDVLAISYRMCYTIPETAISGGVRHINGSNINVEGTDFYVDVSRNCTGAGGDPSARIPGGDRAGHDIAPYRYIFDTHDQSPFCLKPTGSFTSGGTIYDLVSPASYDNQLARADGSLVNSNYNFTYKPRGSVVISGNIRSNGAYATGKGFAYFGGSTTGGGHLMRAWGADCNIGNGIGAHGLWAFTYANDPAHTVNVDENGNYSFTPTPNEQFCIASPSSPTFEGTAYNLNTWFGASNLVDGFATSDSRHDFIYDPIPQAPTITKSSNVGNGTPLTLGQPIDFYLTITNNQDANQPGLHVGDWIPLNMDPNTVSASFSIATTGSAPNSWRICNPGGGTGWVSIYYGNSCDANSLVTDFGMTPTPVGGGGEPLNVNLNLGASPASYSWRNFPWDTQARLPAYSVTTIHIHGNVRANANEIGIYPGYQTNNMDDPADTRYCAGFSGANFSDRSAANGLTHCQDTLNGYQGIANAASLGIDWPIPGHLSNMTYNPIPGTITSLSKTYSNTDTNGTFVFDPVDPGLSHGNFTLGYTANPTGGPVYFAVRDQTSDIPLGAPYSGMQYDGVCSTTARGPDFNSIGCSYFPGGFVHYADANNVPPSAYSPFSLGSTFSFNVRFNAGGTLPPLGGNICNTGDAYYRDYSLPGHPYHVVTSPTICVKRVNVAHPTLNANNGNIYAGSGFEVDASNPGAGCNDVAGAPLNVSVNSGSTSQYVIASRGSVSGITSNTGQYSRSYAQVCRKDLYAALTKEAPTPSASVAGSIGASFAEPASGGWVQGSPGMHIGNINPNNRWTLYVPGDVYIDGNIGGNGMIGIIADNIYIGSGVQNVRALLAAGSVSRGGGRINTCANDAGGGLLNTLASGPAPLNADNCSQILNVQGILYGKRLKFNRTLPVGAPAGPREVITLPPTLFTLLPPGFSTLGISGGATLFAGELPPRY
jgi:hypothetical protein